MNIKETKKSIIQAGHRAVEELIKVAKEDIVDSDEDISWRRGLSFAFPQGNQGRCGGMPL